MFYFTGYVFVSLVLFVLARFSPYEWDNPYPCIEEPEELENQFSLANSFWFTIGSLMQQGSDVAPISLSTRLLAGKYIIMYRVSHGKVNKVIWLCWGYSFWFLLIFWVLQVHELGTFMPNSSVYIFLMLCDPYRMISESDQNDQF